MTTARRAATIRRGLTWSGLFAISPSHETKVVRMPVLGNYLGSSVPLVGAHAA
ncbi:hypothetical protein [Nannocystis punicea]|uniref:Uncharacterized protein n=1 Tax=Nannocystis punicea TaxID=2995304 RepID=A0ABY7H3G8_9BACT|nr:hypothetical protein [Nannocystis poenicansa]WAS93574.1 hypothetical protein O0S08_46165 [Nannocystis poenicansa]